MEYKTDTIIRKIGGSHYIRIPIPILEYLDLAKDGTEVKIQSEKGKKGNYASFWKKQ